MMHAIDDLPPHGSRIMAVSTVPVINDSPTYPATSRDYEDDLVPVG